MKGGQNERTRNKKFVEKNTATNKHLMMYHLQPKKEKSSDF